MTVADLLQRAVTAERTEGLQAAMDLVKQAHRVAGANGTAAERASVLVRWARLALRSGSGGSARESLNRISELDDDSLPAGVLAEAYLVRAEIGLSSGDYASAAEHADRAADAITAADDRTLEAELHLVRGDIAYEGDDDRIAARAAYLRGFAISNELGDLHWTEILKERLLRL